MRNEKLRALRAEAKFHDLYQRIYALEQENARLQRKIDAGPHRTWIETDDPDVVACMGSVPACAQNGCQQRKLSEAHERLTKEHAQFKAHHAMPEHSAMPPRKDEQHG